MNVVLPEPFAGALAQVVSALSADPQVEAIVLGGSAAMNRLCPRSDLDLLLIKCSQVTVMERYAQYVDGVQVQVIAGPPRQYDLWLELDRPQGTVLRQLAEGQLLWDRSGLGAHYQARAAEVVARGLEPMSEPQIRSRRFLLTELVDDAADCAGEPAQQRWLMMTGLSFAVETAFLWQRRWTPKGKRAIEEIEALDPELARLCTDLLKPSDVDTQRTVFEAMVRYVLAPLGGELRGPWARLPEPVAGTKDE
jgi:hypothetical protein